MLALAWAFLPTQTALDGSPTFTYSRCDLDNIDDDDIQILLESVHKCRASNCRESELSVQSSVKAEAFRLVGESMWLWQDRDRLHKLAPSFSRVEPPYFPSVGWNLPGTIARNEGSLNRRVVRMEYLTKRLGISPNASSSFPSFFFSHSPVTCG